MKSVKVDTIEGIQEMQEFMHQHKEQMKELNRLDRMTDKELGQEVRNSIRKRSMNNLADARDVEALEKRVSGLETEFKSSFIIKKAEDDSWCLFDVGENDMFLLGHRGDSDNDAGWYMLNKKQAHTLAFDSKEK